MEGTFVNQPTGRTQCYLCTNCDEGSGVRIKRSCTTTSDRVCEPLEGFYCTDFTMNSCLAAKKHTSCQPGQYISQTEYQIGNECCPKCPAGNRVKTDCKKSRSTSCLPCIEGTFMNHPTGLKQCFPCSNCDPGSGLKMRSSCTTTSDRVCEPLEGFYCTDFTMNSCVAAEKHTRCQPGQYISQTGWFSYGTFTSCQPHTQCESENLLIKPGTAASDAECGEKSLKVTVIVICVVVPILVICVAAFFVWKNKKCLSGKICVQSKKLLSWFNG
uniref:TNFR-Cys domain-containing protein n=1 Tax=Seriola lalandi dorsalis TaxID=1841481 RepID=A0A3B4W9Y7_SERLL